MRFLRSDAVEVLSNEIVRKTLGRYFAVVKNEKPAKFLIAKRVPADFDETDSMEELWREHSRATDKFMRIQSVIDNGRKDLGRMDAPEKSFLNLKVEIAKRIMSACHLCTRRCGVNRFLEKSRYCGCGSEITVSSVFEHTGEEPELVPSGTVFTMGCTMRCVHCQNWTISQWMEKGEVYAPERLAREVERLREGGCRNANLVGGEPTPWLEQWLQTFKHVNMSVPVVWNSNTYYSPETARLLNGFADVYLLDFKYGPGGCAERISDAPDYWNVCTRNHLEAKECGELIIRVLVLPNHLNCCLKPILQWIVENLGRKTRVNVMFQYRPEWRASEIRELRRQLTHDEMEQALESVKETKLENTII